jgi:hypothetical protein
LMVRWMPQIPPTPFSVKPKPSWMGKNSTEMMMRKLYPGRPSGSLVSMSPIALTFTLKTSSASTPA